MKKFLTTKILAKLKKKLFIFLKQFPAQPHNFLYWNLNTLFVKWIQQTDWILEMHFSKLARWDQNLKIWPKIAISEKVREWNGRKNLGHKGYYMLEHQSHYSLKILHNGQNYQFGPFFKKSCSLGNGKR